MSKLLTIYSQSTALLLLLLVLATYGNDDAARVGREQKEGSSQASRRSIAIPIDPAAAPVFPHAQYSAACGIITIEGLDYMDGDYVLLDKSASPGESPAWIGASQETQDLVLSWQPLGGVWTIGVRDLPRFARAYLPVESDMPPAYSSRWQIFDVDSSDFEEVGNAVSIYCPGTV